MANLEAIEQEMRSLAGGISTSNFPHGLRTGNGQQPGYDAKARWNFIAPHVPADLPGKTVLDLGAMQDSFPFK